MDHKRFKVQQTTVTRNLAELHEPTGNIYESVSIISKRANQIAMDIKEELDRKISEFATPNDNLEEVFENREQIEIAKYYEQLPKSTLVAIHEFVNQKVYFRNPDKES